MAVSLAVCSVELKVVCLVEQWAVAWVVERVVMKAGWWVFCWAVLWVVEKADATVEM